MTVYSGVSTIFFSLGVFSNIKFITHNMFFLGFNKKILGNGLLLF